MNPDMKRLKILAAIAVLGIPLAACEEATPPPPVGSIVGTVSIEGTGIDGVSVNLSNGTSTTTAAGGSYRFDNVEGGAYTVTISGFPSDATFDATSAAVTIASAGQSVTVNFSGAYIRTASVMGSVTVENMGLPGVTVTLTGVSGATATTDDSGQYAFTGLRMGSYSVEISSFDSDEVGFSSTSASVTVGVGESKIVSFDGTYLRTAGIMGRVSVDGEGLEGVNVSLSGGPDGVNETTTTDAAGQYSFAKLRAGGYAVGISGYDTDDYEFEVTSQNVTVALGETANVPFEGVLLRTSGISGRVSVEGMGLEDIAVTLTAEGVDTMTAMTDVGGLYAFAGLAVGDYNVAIEVESEAYVFETMAMDVTVGDDETAIVNFEGMHARTASVSGMLFIDELMKNDMYDEGEEALPHAGVPVVLVGPGVNDQMPSVTNEMGQFAFTGLKAGDFQLVVPVTEPMGDFAYGGSATGYTLSVGVGEAVMQNIPIDITHTTVHFGVTLKADSVRGMPLPGAVVTLYADAMGETKVGEDTTMVNEETMHAAASIRVARAGTTGNMVYASVSAEGYHVADGMTAVMWDPQKTHTMAANDNDILNLSVDLAFSGTTVTTEYGGGDALAGWAITVVEGDSATADTLDADGMGALQTTAASVPMTYTISVDTIQVDSLDGGEKFEATAVTYTHTGLMLAGTVDAGTMEATYTTQSLKVGVHHELDQVMGYTGNVLDGDVRDDGTVVDLGIRYIDVNGRSRAFTTKEWDAGKNTSFKDGVTTFAHLPADANIVVQASVSDTLDVMLLEPDELAAYTDMEASGIVGGAFGDMGGFSHTVSLCPLQAVDPTAQDYGECSSFAYVSTYTVTGLVWKNEVLLSDDDANDDGFKMGEKGDDGPTFVPGIAVSLDPVEGKNLAGGQQAFTTLAKANPKTDHPDDTHHFQFADIASGVYKLTIPDGWRARMGADLTEIKGAEGAADAVANALNPLGGDLGIDITPTTTTVYGYVRDSDGFPVEDVTVTANGVAATTDVHGRYIAEYVPSATNKRGEAANTNTIAVGTTHKSSAKTDTVFGFVANYRHRADVEISGAGETASISGTVTASGSGAPISGVRIMVEGLQKSSFNAKVPPTAAANNALVTGADGSYTAVIEAKELGESVEVTVSKDGMSFAPATLSVPAHGGAEISGIDFTGFLHARISGRVKGPDGSALGGVMVKATNAIEGAAGGEATTTSNARGTFVLSVPFGTYTITAEKDNYTFSYPLSGNTVSTAPGQTVDFGNIQAMTFGALNVQAVRQRTAQDANTDADETERLDGNIRVRWSGNDSTAVPAGYDEVAYLVEQDYAASGTFVDASASLVTDSTRVSTFASPGDTAFMVRITATATDIDNSGPGGTTLDPIVINSAEVTVAAIDPSASGVTATRVADTISASWNAVTHDNSQFRVVAQMSVAQLGGSTVWVVLNGATAIDDIVRDFSLPIPDDYSTAHPVIGGASVTITAADLNGALMVRVDARQDGVDVDDQSAAIWPEERQGTAVAVGAKPTS